MKTSLIIIALCISPFFAICQNKTDTLLNGPKVKIPINESGYIEYAGVVKLDSTSKAQTLYKAAKTWFVNNFNSAKSVIQSDDQNNGRLLGRAFVTVHQKGFTLIEDPQVYFYIQIDVKDGKYRYKFYNFVSYITFMNNTTEQPFTQSYDKYLNNSLDKPALVSTKTLYLRADYFYSDFQSQILRLIINLNSAMKNSKSDDF